jgi:hypothetical protein
MDPRRPKHSRLWNAGRLLAVALVWVLPIPVLVLIVALLVALSFSILLALAFHVLFSSVVVALALLVLISVWVLILVRITHGSLPLSAECRKAVNEGPRLSVPFQAGQEGPAFDLLTVTPDHLSWREWSCYLRECSC